MGPSKVSFIDESSGPVYGEFFTIYPPAVAIRDSKHFKLKVSLIERVF